MGAHLPKLVGADFPPYRNPLSGRAFWDPSAEPLLRTPGLQTDRISGGMLWPVASNDYTWTGSLLYGRRFAWQGSNHSHEETPEPSNPLSPRNRQKTRNCTFFFSQDFIHSIPVALIFLGDEGEILGFWLPSIFQGLVGVGCR